MKCIKHMNQRIDGGFDYFVIFGTHAPWDAPEELSVHCATEHDAEKLIKIMEVPNAEITGSALLRNPS